jgi:hypothetical protein
MVLALVLTVIPAGDIGEDKNAISSRANDSIDDSVGLVWWCI